MHWKHVVPEQSMQLVTPQLAKHAELKRVKLVLQTAQTSGTEQEAQLETLHSNVQVLLAKVYPAAQA